MRVMLAILVAATLFLSESALAVSITNGSLTGPLGPGLLPTGWSLIGGSPDTMDENHNLGSTLVGFGVTPSGPSPDGGTWVGLARRDTFIEEFGQGFAGLSIGTQYSVSWYEGNFGSTSGSPTWTGTNAIELLIDGVSTGSGSLLPLGPTWSTDSVVFTATSGNHEISFRLLNTTKSYLSIDGISIQAVPEPGTALLFAGGLLGMTLHRRHQRV